MGRLALSAFIVWLSAGQGPDTLTAAAINAPTSVSCTDIWRELGCQMAGGGFRIGATVGESASLAFISLVFIGDSYRRLLDSVRSRQNSAAYKFWYLRDYGVSE